MQIKNRKILLFDIDWTLVHGLNLTHSASFKFMFEKVFGLKDINVYDIRPNGMTDLQIISEILRIHNLLDMFKKKQVNIAINVMGEYYVKNAHKEKITLMTGVENLLNALKRDGYLMGVLSGNIERIGIQKLEDASILEYFSFAAFGSMSTLRSELVGFAEKDMQKHGIKANKDQFIIIGDSMRDIECARDSKLPCISVATGAYSKNELQLAGSSFVVDTLEDINSVMEFISNC